MSQFDQWIDRLARRVRLGEFLHRAANWLAVYLLVVGALILAGKLLVPREIWPGPLGGGYRPAVSWLLVLCGLGSAVLLAISWWKSERSRLSRTDLVAWLDRRLGVGGLLMTLSETATAADDQAASWATALPEHQEVWRKSMPPVRPRRFTSYVAVPAVFAIVACVVPWRMAFSSSTLQNTVGQRETQELVQLLEELKEAGVLEQQEQEKLDEEIQKLAEDTSRSPLTHEKWETVDSLRERMQMRLDSSARSLDKALSAVRSLESAEFDSNGELADLDPEYSEQLLEDIRDALKNTSIDELPPSLQDLARRYSRQQAGQEGEGQKGEDGKEPKGQETKAGRDGKAQGKGRKGQGKQAKDKSGRRGKKNKSAGGTNRRFGLPRDPAQRQQALQDLKEFLQQESQQLQELRQQAQRNPGGT
tara:strand:+ start:746 stop:2002 length:1257 start_codon:yes stop_codon:yes gene_type:complete